ncbi:MAG: hypothetical protein COV73_02915 [Candidatus Omnitrophica bacterium CG11_big_fil_rev_8_21_14_0_20_43_6]|nr:MAG: hypothetical protein COV73_02915 [Candidatus Omnitrophica bacterium CG11_big_fil_rev_8_21_14_0_20_43_6]
MLFKNLTFPDRGRKIIASSEVADKEGVHSVVRRHFSYIVKPIQRAEVIKPQPYLYVLKERNTKERHEHFFCKVKGSVLVVNNGHFFLILFVHTLSVDLTVSLQLTKPIA